MQHKYTSVQGKLRRAILLTSGAVLLLTCAAFFAYEIITYRQTALRELSTLAKIIALNSTAALAFDNREDSEEILMSLRAEPHIVAAALYDDGGRLFSKYPADLPESSLPPGPEWGGFRFQDSFVQGFQPVVHADRQLGTLYLKSDMGAMFSRLKLYGLIVIVIVGASFLVAYALSRNLQKKISGPIFSLAETARAISEHRDYSVRVSKLSDDEIGLLTDAFNDMLMRIQEQNKEITSFSLNLEQRVQERTTELQVANRELEAFSYTVSHDLRAPLRHIRIYTDMLFNKYGKSMDDDALRIMEVILKNTGKMEQLVKDLLDFSQAGRKELVKEDVRMKDIVMSAWEEVKRMEGERPIELQVGKLTDAYADVGTIKQVWLNLIANAIKFTRHKRNARVAISSEETENEITYCVQDNGAGFDMKNYNRLFGVFQRLHSQKDFEGTGVGLAIVERIINRHGGRIWARAKPEEGATFYFTLPKSIIFA